jgi:hypothetical protein
MAAAATGLERLLDPRGVAKPQVFDGSESNWPAWCFVFESYALLLSKDLAKHMDKAADLDDEPFLHEMMDNAVELARVLYAILVSVVQNKALSILMNTEKGNGLQAWRRLKREYEPKLPGRHATMLAGLIAPAWSSLTVPQFRQKFLEWEVAVSRYETQSDEQLSDSLKVAVLNRHSPQDVRTALRSHISVIGTIFPKMRAFLNDYLGSGAEFDSGGFSVVGDAGGMQPMDVGALFKGKGGG